MQVAVLLVSIFAALVLITRTVCAGADGLASFWPANAAIVVAVLVLPGRLAAGTALACLGVNLGLNTLSALSPADSLLYSLLNVAQGTVVALLMRSYCGAMTDLTRLRRLGTFGCIAVAASAGEAAIGEFLGGAVRPGQELALGWLQWTLCDSLGLLLAAPAILLIVRSIDAPDRRRVGAIERCVLLGFTIALAVVSFELARAPLFLLIYPMIIALAFRAGPAWVLASVLIVSVIATALTVHGFGPIAWLSPNGGLKDGYMLQPYLLSLFLAAVPPNNALSERVRTARRLEQLTSNLERAATHDSLTSLMNRRLFTRHLDTCLASGSSGAVLFVDLDGFKHVNDTLGHQSGDELLIAFCAQLTAVARGVDGHVARFGGDEFAVLVGGGQDASQVEALAAAIVETVRAPYQLERGRAYVTASIGIALIRAGDHGTDELMRRADAALYAAKECGRDGFTIFTEELDRRARDGGNLERDLRTALEGGGGLTLNYQLKVSADGRATSCETLLRWRHPTLGPISPDRFIPLSEKTGLIVPLGEWVFREAVAFAARWPRLSVAVNVSPVQLRDKQFAIRILDVLRRAAVAPGRIELEVTETALFEDVQLAANSLATLKAAGLRIALDDFGTGYSSLRHLHRFAVDRIKIDQSFVRGLNDGTEAATIVPAIIQLGHALGTQMTAEGVETAEQRDFLVCAGIDEMQGYWFARPVSETDLSEQLVKLERSVQRPPVCRTTPAAARRAVPVMLEEMMSTLAADPA